MININHTLMIKINNQKKKMNYLMLIMKKKILEKYMKIILMILIENFILWLFNHESSIIITAFIKCYKLKEKSSC